jgi:hypothetical protein
MPALPQTAPKETQVISRRYVVAASPVLALGSRLGAATPEAQMDPLTTMMRMRGSVDGRSVAGWLDAERSTVIDGEIVPFCRILAATVSRFQMMGDACEATTLEVAYYLDPETGKVLDKFRFPGSAEAVAVPLYRAGPAKIRFAVDVDYWEENEPTAKGAASTAFAPRSSVHLQRSIGAPRVHEDSVYMRSNEYGRVYPVRDAPPTIFYREWMVWRADAADVRGDAPSIPADFMYSALSSWRPWMKMGTIKGHTAENGRGAKVASPADFPDELKALILAKDPDVMKGLAS